MAGGVANDPFMAYQEAAKVMSTKKGSSSRSAYGDEVMVTGSRRSTVVKLEPFPSLPGKKPKSGGMTTRSVQQLADMARSVGSLAMALSDLNLNVFPQDSIVLPIGDPSEVVQVIQGGLLWVSLPHARFPFQSCSLIEICVLCRPFLSCTVSGSDCPMKACRSSERRSRT